MDVAIKGSSYISGEFGAVAIYDATNSTKAGTVSGPGLGD